MKSHEAEETSNTGGDVGAKGEMSTISHTIIHELG